ncbi:alpha/beta fold hydrolase [Streptomyces sp. NPDC058391]|uniref:alpha/beta fold hydrolase n=1 Tax=Streptomyces sp. NPDC058391 TaxID=3346476 RepID=UPI00365A4F7C
MTTRDTAAATTTAATAAATTATAAATATTRTVISDGVRLACTDYGGAGRPVLLLHGLAGHTAEWDSLARLLLPAHRVVAYDARGHGASDRHPTDVSRAAHVRDVVAVVGQLALDRPVLVGQSFGGLTALLAAAAHPDLAEALGPVRPIFAGPRRLARHLAALSESSKYIQYEDDPPPCDAPHQTPRAGPRRSTGQDLVLVEAGPRGPDPELPAKIGAWLDSWPVPFASADAATEFFGDGPAGRAWAAGLAEHPDGLRPRVDRDVMVACVAENAERSFWTEWDRVRCPALVVRGDAGWMPETEADEMRVRHPGTDVRVVPAAGHDVHLDQPRALHDAITEFLGQRNAG